MHSSLTEINLFSHLDCIPSFPIGDSANDPATLLVGYFGVDYALLRQFDHFLDYEYGSEFFLKGYLRHFVLMLWFDWYWMLFSVQQSLQKDVYVSRSNGQEWSSFSTEYHSYNRSVWDYTYVRLNTFWKQLWYPMKILKLKSPIKFCVLVLYFVLYFLWTLWISTWLALEVYPPFWLLIHLWILFVCKVCTVLIGFNLTWHLTFWTLWISIWLSKAL